MSKFKVKIKDWLRGEGGDESYLLRKSDGKMCCLGQVALQCGCKKSEITNFFTPFHQSILPKMPQWMHDWENSDNQVHEAMRINDSQEIGDKERKEKLIELFKNNGDELEFH